jgi:RimJ/RimL family protein N-acetyltransferase
MSRASAAARRHGAERCVRLRSPDVRPIDFPSPPLDDGVVALRGFDEGDVAAVVRACQDPEIPRWTIIPSPYGEREARAWIETHDLLRITATAVPFAIVDAQTRVLVGSIGVHDLDGRSRKGEVGYWIAQPHRGRGAATRALRLLARWAFGELGLARLELLADVRNVASHHVAERAGFVREGVLRSAREIKGARCDMVLYARLPTDDEGPEPPAPPARTKLTQRRSGDL